MNDEKRSKHDGKRRKKSKRSVKYPEIAKKLHDENPGHHQKDHVGGVTQDRLTCKSGIYTIGKMSIPIHRGVKLSEEIAQAKANQDLKKILNLANENAAIQFSSVTEPQINIEANVEKRKSVFSTTPRSHPSVVKSMSSRSAELSTQLSPDTDMQSPLGEEAPTIISRFLKSKQKEIFPVKNYLEEALGDLRQRYKHMINQNNISVDFHAQQQAYTLAATMQNTAPKMQSDDNLIEMPHVSPKLVNRDENVILDIFASPRSENVKKDCFVNSPNQMKPSISHYKQPVVTNLKCPPQPGYFLPVKNECSTYKPSPKCSLMEWDSNVMFREAISDKGKRMRLEPSPTFSPNLKWEESSVDATRVLQSSPSDVSIWAPSEVSSQNLPVFEPTPSPRFYRYKLC